MDPVCERPDVLRVIRLLVAALVLGVEGAHQGPVTETSILWSVAGNVCLDHKLSQVYLRSLSSL